MGKQKSNEVLGPEKVSVSEIFPESITSGMVCAGGPGAATCMVILFPFPDLNFFPVKF